jgi:hypothetical protein
MKLSKFRKLLFISLFFLIFITGINLKSTFNKSTRLWYGCWLTDKSSICRLGSHCVAEVSSVVASGVWSYETLQYPAFVGFRYHSTQPTNFQIFQDFCQSTSNKPQYIRELPFLDKQQQTDIDRLYQQRLRSLQAIDESLLSLYNTLKTNNQLDNTYLPLPSCAS